MCRFATKTLAESLPRKIFAWKDEWPILVFTDGACEDEGAKVTHGAVLCDMATKSFLVFGEEFHLSLWMNGRREAESRSFFKLRYFQYGWQKLLGRTC